MGVWSWVCNWVGRRQVGVCLRLGVGLICARLFSECRALLGDRGITAVWFVCEFMRIADLKRQMVTRVPSSRARAW